MVALNCGLEPAVEEGFEVVPIPTERAAADAIHE